MFGALVMPAIMLVNMPVTVSVITVEMTP